MKRNNNKTKYIPVERKKNKYCTKFKGVNKERRSMLSSECEIIQGICFDLCERINLFNKRKEFLAMFWTQRIRVSCQLLLDLLLLQLVLLTRVSSVLTMMEDSMEQHFKVIREHHFLLLLLLLNHTRTIACETTVFTASCVFTIYRFGFQRSLRKGDSNRQQLLE